MRTRLLFIFTILITHSILLGQDHATSENSPDVKFAKFFDGRFENGLMLSNNTDEGDQLVNSSYYNGVDFRLGFRKTDTSDVYSTVYRRPIIGLGWYTSTFQNDAVGEPTAIYFFITVPLKFEGIKKLTYSYTAAFGLSYNFNPYNPEENPANVLLGSERNCYVHLGFLANYKFSPRFSANATIGFKHFSNGSYQKPNAGINLVPLTLGLSYRLTEKNAHLEKTYMPDFIKHGAINISFAAGSKNYEVGGENYLKTTLGINYLRHFNYKYRGGVGLDIFYSDDSELRNSSDQSLFSKQFSFALVGAWEWHLTRRLYAPVGLAFYLHRNVENGEELPFYERAGLAYRFNNNIFAGVTIKAHGAVADYFEWTIGYTIQHDPNAY